MPENINDKIKNIESADLELNKKVYGENDKFARDDMGIKDNIRNSIEIFNTKFSTRMHRDPINYMSEVNLSTFYDSKKSGGKTPSAQKQENGEFKKQIEKLSFNEINDMILHETPRNLLFGNYSAIYNHIPQAAQAVDVFKDNIISPDDFSKDVFNIGFEDSVSCSTQKEAIVQELNDISKKYGIEDMLEEIIERTLVFGELYITALSLDTEVTKMLSSQEGDELSKSILSESFVYDSDGVTDLKEAHLSEEEREFLKESVDIKKDADINKVFTKFINEQVKVVDKSVFLLERFSVENEMQNKIVDTSKYKGEERMSGVDGLDHKKEKEKNKPRSYSSLGLNGSVVKLLDPERVIELKVDNIVYGYLYYEKPSIGSSEFGNDFRKTKLSPNADAGEMQSTIGSGSVTTGQMSTAFISNMSKRMDTISNMLINNIAKKIDKPFIAKNKHFRDVIYTILKQKYIIEQKINITFLEPDEIVKFSVPPIFRKVLFFSRLYLAMLTNTLLMKMGRGHDKRLFYVEMGDAADMQETIMGIVQDIKTKEFRMDHMNDINTILNLCPGYFDDYYIPSKGGQRPIDIETLQGMSVDINNEFLEFLLDSIVAGTGVPRTLIDALKEVDFARTFSAQNGNFLRSVVKAQKILSKGFNKLFRILYRNEYQYDGDGESEKKASNEILDKIKISFPSPASLNLTNMNDQLAAAIQQAESVSSILVSENEEQAENLRQSISKKMVSELVPSIDWADLDDFLEEIKTDLGVAKKDKDTSSDSF